MLTPASSRILARALSSRSFHASARRLNDSAPLPARKPMGAFRGGYVATCLGCDTVTSLLTRNPVFSASCSAASWPAVPSTATSCRSTRHLTSCLPRISTLRHPTDKPRQDSRGEDPAEEKVKPEKIKKHK
nr:hypothetical protein [Trichoderma harzianum]